MTTPLDFPDVLEHVRLEALPPLGVPRVVKVPSPRPPRFVKLTNSGGEVMEDGLVLRQLLTFEVWDRDDRSAHDLAVSVLHAVVEWVDSAMIVEDAEVTWPVSYPDPETTSTRYTFTVQFYVLPNIQKENDNGDA